MVSEGEQMAAWNLNGHVFRNNLERRETSVNCLLRDIYIRSISIVHDPSCCKDCCSLSIFLFFERRRFSFGQRNCLMMIRFIWKWRIRGSIKKENLEMAKRLWFNCRGLRIIKRRILFKILEDSDISLIIKRQIFLTKISIYSTCIKLKLKIIPKI